MQAQGLNFTIGWIRKVYHSRISLLERATALPQMFLDSTLPAGHGTAIQTAARLGHMRKTSLDLSWEAIARPDAELTHQINHQQELQILGLPDHIPM
jgi:hypothetical protein